MPDETVLEFGVINIFADPHPQGIYPKLLRRIAHTPVKLWGDDYLALTERCQARGAEHHVAREATPCWPQLSDIGVFMGAGEPSSGRDTLFLQPFLVLCVCRYGLGDLCADGRVLLHGKLVLLGR